MAKYSRKSAKKRNAEAARLDDTNHSKDDVSDHNDSDSSTGRNLDYKSKTIENAKSIYVPGSSSEGDTKQFSAEEVDNNDPLDSNGEPRNTLDPLYPLPRKRRKKPSEKLRWKQEFEVQLEIKDESHQENRSSQSGRRTQNRKTPSDNAGSRYKKSRLKKLDKEEEKAVLERARQKGLPEGWMVAYHKDWKRKIWISPDETRICDTVPRAIAIWEKMTTEDEMDNDDTEKVSAERDLMDEDAFDGKRDGAQDDRNEKEDDDDDEGVKVANSFVTLKKGSVQGSDPASMLIATSEDLHEMSEKQEQAALKKGRSKGLREEGWRCAWNSRFRRKNWVSPQGRLFGNLSRAVEKQDDWIKKEERKKMKANQKLQEAEEEWQKQLRRLKKYERRHGDTLVPDHYERYIELPSWVRKQRREYSRFQQGMKSHITPEQIEELNNIGFQWVVAKVPKRVSKKSQAAAASQPLNISTQEVTKYTLPPEGSIFDNAPEEMFTRRHLLFSDMQPPPVSPARVPIKFVNPIRKLANGSLGTESYCREVEQYLKTWYGAGEAN